MAIVAVRCPSCNGDIDLEQDREFGFCVYCGTKIHITSAVQRIKGTVSIDRQQEVQGYLSRAQQHENEGDFGSAEEYYRRALDIDPSNQYARDGYERTRRIMVSPNLTIDYKYADRGLRKHSSVFVNGKKIGKAEIGSQTAFLLPFGEHEVFISSGGSKSNVLKVNIVGRQTRTVLYCKEGFMRPKLTVKSIT